MIYVASPYSHINSTVREERYIAVRQFVAHKITRSPAPLFSPIIYAHELAVHHGLAGDFATWRSFNIGMLRIAQALWVLRIPGWDSSVGVQTEIDLAQSIILPIFHFEPNGSMVV